MTLSIFSYAYWPYLIRELSSHILHPFSSGFFYHWVVRILYVCSTQAPYQICKNFLQFCGLYFHFPDDVFCSMRIFFILMSSLSIFFFFGLLLVLLESYLRRLCLVQYHENVCLHVLLKFVLACTFRLLIHFWSIFVDDVRGRRSNFIPWHVAIQLSQNALLNCHMMGSKHIFLDCSTIWTWSKSLPSPVSETPADQCLASSRSLKHVRQMNVVKVGNQSPMFRGWSPLHSALGCDPGNIFSQRPRGQSLKRCLGTLEWRGQTKLSLFVLLTLVMPCGTAGRIPATQPGQAITAPNPNH